MPIKPVKPATRRPSFRRPLVALLAVPALVTVVAPHADAAGRGGADVQARPAICTPGECYYSVARPTIKHGVTHATIVERYTGGKATRTYRASKVAVLDAKVAGSVDIESGASAKIFKLFSASAKTHFHIDVAVRGSYTSRSAKSVTDTLPGNDTYVFYAGKNRYTSSWRESRCISSGRAYETVRTGTVRSYAIDVDGAVGCYRQSPPSRTMAYAVQRTYC